MLRPKGFLLLLVIALLLSITGWKGPAVHLPRAMAATTEATRPYITTRDVTVRSGPGSQYGIVAEIKSGTRVYVTGREAGWLKVVSEHGNPPGYIDERNARPDSGFIDTLYEESQPSSVSTVQVLETPGDVDRDISRLQALRPNPQRWAVIIGIEKYQQTFGALFARRDAQSFKEYAQKLLEVPQENIFLLLDEEATKTRLQVLLEERLPRRLKPGDQVFVYYAGHGLADPRTGQPYLLPSDADLQSIQLSGYSAEAFYGALGRLKEQRVIVFLDACFSGIVGRQQQVQPLLLAARPLVLTVEDPAVKHSNITVLAAAQHDQLSNSDPENGHGLFTYHLLKGLMGEADANRDGRVGLVELASYVKDTVDRKARQLYGQTRDQTPVLTPATLDARQDIELTSRTGKLPQGPTQGERVAEEAQRKAQEQIRLAEEALAQARQEHEKELDRVKERWEEKVRKERERIRKEFEDKFASGTRDGPAGPKPGTKESAEVTRGKALLKKKDFQGALKSAEAALKINPQYDDAWQLKGDALAGLKRFQEAVESYDKVIEVFRQDPVLWYRRGLALQDSGRFQDAVKSFDRALEIDPGMKVAIARKALSLQKLGNHGEALKAIDTGIQIDPDWTLFHIQGDSLLALKRCDEAKWSFDEALARNPKYLLTRHGKDEALRECDGR